VAIVEIEYETEVNRGRTSLVSVHGVLISNQIEEQEHQFSLRALNPQKGALG
jgi:hypothetical protein